MSSEGAHYDFLVDYGAPLELLVKAFSPSATFSVLSREFDIISLKKDIEDGLERAAASIPKLTPNLLVCPGDNLYAFFKHVTSSACKLALSKLKETDSRKENLLRSIVSNIPSKEHYVGGSRQYAGQIRSFTERVQYQVDSRPDLVKLDDLCRWSWNVCISRSMQLLNIKAVMGIIQVHHLRSGGLDKWDNAEKGINKGLQDFVRYCYGQKPKSLHEIDWAHAFCSPTYDGARHVEFFVRVHTAIFQIHPAPTPHPDGPDTFTRKSLDISGVRDYYAPTKEGTSVYTGQVGMHFEQIGRDTTNVLGFVPYRRSVFWFQRDLPSISLHPEDYESERAETRPNMAFANSVIHSFLVDGKGSPLYAVFSRILKVVASLGATRLVIGYIKTFLESLKLGSDAVNLVIDTCGFVLEVANAILPTDPKHYTSLLALVAYVCVFLYSNCGSGRRDAWSLGSALRSLLQSVGDMAGAFVSIVSPPVYQLFSGHEDTDHNVRMNALVATVVSATLAGLDSGEHETAFASLQKVSLHSRVVGLVSLVVKRYALKGMDVPGLQFVSNAVCWLVFWKIRLLKDVKPDDYKWYTEYHVLEAMGYNLVIDSIVTYVGLDRHDPRGKKSKGSGKKSE